MIRLLLNPYSYEEALVLYSALVRARSFLSDNPGKPAKDLDEALSYLTGYSDAMLKEGKKCLQD